MMRLSTRLLPLLLLTACVRPEAPRSEWNEEQIAWRSWAEGEREARAAKKPILMVVQAQWCPHCHTYAKVFHDPRVVAEAKKFVMVRIDKDAEPALSSRFQLDGEYVPRTHFLTPEGVLRPELHAERSRYRYFFDTRDPLSLLSAMHRAP